MSNDWLKYYDESSKGEELFFTDAPKKKNIGEKSRFFRVIGEPDKIIKYSVTGLDIDKTMEMLDRFHLVKDNVTRTKLPDSLYKENGVISGTVPPFFEDCPSLYTISETHSLPILSEYYKKDDDEIHNFFILLRDILDGLEELNDNSIGYSDSNPGNFILSNNKVQLIDFDPNYLFYDIDKNSVKKLLSNYDELVFLLCRRFELIDLPAFQPKDFKGMRKRLDKVENKVYKLMR